MGTDFFHCGELGAGQTMKLINNLLATGVARGVGRRRWSPAPRPASRSTRCCRCCKTTMAWNNQLAIAMPKRPLAGDFKPGFMMKLAHKDCRLALQMVDGARRRGAGRARAALASLEEGLDSGLQDDDVGALLKLREEAAGVRGAAAGAGVTVERAASSGAAAGERLRKRMASHPRARRLLLRRRCSIRATTSRRRSSTWPPARAFRLRVGDAARDVVTLERIAAGHKFALRALAAGAAGAQVRRGHRLRDAGDRRRRVGARSQSRAATRSTRSVGAAAGAEADPRPGASVRAGSATKRGFDGYRRRDGRVGVRNHVLVLSPTGLTSAAARRVASLVRGTVCVAVGIRARADRRRREAALRHARRSGDASERRRRRRRVGRCRHHGHVRRRDRRDRASRRSALSLPGVHEDALALVDAGVRAAARLVHEASALRRERCDLADLCIAVECGHSDATSGLVCNPLAGRMMEAVVGGGGQAMFSETVEWTGAEHLLARARRDAGRGAAHRRRRRRTASAWRAKPAAICARRTPARRTRRAASRRSRRRRWARSPRAAGSRSGTCCAPRSGRSAPGLYLMDTPYFSPESMTAMVAGGAQIVVFTTGAGNSYTSLIAPTLKMSANPGTTSRLDAQIDFAASGVLRGTSSSTSSAMRGVARLLDIASGIAHLRRDRRRRRRSGQPRRPFDVAAAQGRPHPSDPFATTRTSMSFDPAATRRIGRRDVAVSQLGVGTAPFGSLAADRHRRFGARRIRRTPRRRPALLRHRAVLRPGPRRAPARRVHARRRSARG